MRFWTLEAGVAAALSLLTMIALVIFAGWLSSRWGRLRWMPRALMAGGLGLVFGPPLLDVLPVTRLGLETLVYHGLGLVFAAVALRKPSGGHESGHDARIIAAALPGIASVQALVGIVVVAAIMASGQAVHVGFGLLLPLGFNQGPGQALSMGEAWEPLGLTDGGAIGLIIAALGFAWCAMGGAFLILGALRKGHRSAVAKELDAGPNWRRWFEPRMVPVVLSLAVVYAVTYLCLWALGRGVVENPRTLAMVYGFHFMIALSLGVVMRPLAARMGQTLDDTSLATASASMVDVTTTAALAAISIGVLNRWLGPVLLLASVGGVVTLAVCVWLRRHFAQDGLEHAVLVYGIATGTFLTGMALLRAIDPDFRSPAARNAVVAAGAEVVFAAPLLLFVMPYAVTRFETDPWASLASTGGMLAGYSVFLLLAGVWMTRRHRLRRRGQITSKLPIARPAATDVS